jgi:hypothetical protein
MDWKNILAVIIFLIAVAALLYTGRLFVELLAEMFDNIE